MPHSDLKQIKGVAPVWNGTRYSSRYAWTYIHSHTTDTWPAVPLGLVFVVGPTSLQDGLINTTTPSNNTFDKTKRVSLFTNSTINYTFLQPVEKQMTILPVKHQQFVPTTALLAEEMTFFEPEGSLTRDFLVSGLWEITVA